MIIAYIAYYFESYRVSILDSIVDTYIDKLVLVYNYTNRPLMIWKREKVRRLQPYSAKEEAYLINQSTIKNIERIETSEVIESTFDQFIVNTLIKEVNFLYIGSVQ